MAPGALRVSRRHQRSPPTRQRTSSWQDKTQQFEKLKLEQQEEAARAARRRARYVTPDGNRSSSSGGESGRTGGAAADAAAAAGVSRSSTSAPAAAVSAPPRGVWWFLKGGDKGRRAQPLNPLMHLNEWKGKPRHDPEARAAQRLLEAISGLRKRNSRRRVPMAVELSDEQRKDIVNRYVSTRWYAKLYAPVRNVTDGQVRWLKRLCHLCLIVIACVAVGLSLYGYYLEMDAVQQLSPEDQHDYAYMVRGMRYSDIYYCAEPVLKKEDPLEALPLPVRLHIVIEACREKKWHEVNWETELRKMHPGTPLQEFDYIHICYWVMMELGRIVYGGGGSLFNDRVLDLREAHHSGKEPEVERNRFVEYGPTQRPPQKGRGFFS